MTNFYPTMQKIHLPSYKRLQPKDCGEGWKMGRFVSLHSAISYKIDSAY